MTDECITCGAYVGSCPVGAIAEVLGTCPITLECTDSRACVDICSVDASID